MKNLIRKVIKGGGQTKIIFLFVVLILIPIGLNIYFIHSRTIEVVKEEKISVSKEVLKKTTETIELKLSDISKSISEFTDNLAIGASIVKYQTITSSYQEKIDNHISTKIEEIVDNNLYIDDVVCLTKEGRVYSAKGLIKFNEEMLLKGLKLKEMQSSKNEELLFSTDVLTEKGVKEKGVMLFRSIYHIPLDNDKANTSSTSGNQGRYDEVGYVFAYINKEKLININNNGGKDLLKGHEIIIYNHDFSPIIGTPSIDIPKYLIMNLSSNDTDIIMKERVIDNQKIVLGVSTIEPAEWRIASWIPVEALIKSTKTGLRGSIVLLGIISIIVVLVIIFQTLAFSKTIIDKGMVDYKLTVSEEVNEKLGIYKHDFMNHLQIIQGLLQMGYPERATKYLKNVVKEGNSINTDYKIGIPELEVTLNAIINQAREEDIEVEIEVSEITEELPITTIELIKIIMNLTNNAIFALISVEDDHKLLKIKIKNNIDSYVFEVSNNIPIIPDPIHKEIFEKGFSTKGEGGNGLGLYIIRKLLKKYKGSIELVVSEEGNNFIVKIPKNKNFSFAND